MCSRKKDKPDHAVKKFLSRFRRSKGTNSLLIVILLLSCIITIFSTYNIESISLSTSIEEIDTDSKLSDETLKSIILWNVTKEISVIIASAIGVNLVLSLCLEKSNKNKAFDEFFTEEIISSPTFYNNLPQHEKIAMLHALEENYYGNSSWQKTMHDSINKKLKKEEEENYVILNSLHNVSCTILSDCIKKVITKKVTLTPISEDIKKLENHRLLKYTAKTIAGQDNVTSFKVKIDGVEVNKDNITYDNPYAPISTVDQTSGYDKCQEIFLKELDFSSTDKRTLEINYTTFAPLSDLCYVCRLSAPCQHFRLDFNITNQKSYNINTYAFGFIDDGKESIIQNAKNQTSIEFNDWIFTRDGVAIFFKKK